MSFSEWASHFVSGVFGNWKSTKSLTWKRRRLHGPRHTEALETRVLLSGTNEPGSDLGALFPDGSADPTRTAGGMFAPLAPDPAPFPQTPGDGTDVMALEVDGGDLEGSDVDGDVSGNDHDGVDHCGQDPGGDDEPDGNDVIGDNLEDPEEVEILPIGDARGVDVDGSDPDGTDDGDDEDDPCGHDLNGGDPDGGDPDGGDPDGGDPDGGDPDGGDPDGGGDAGGGDPDGGGDAGVGDPDGGDAGGGSVGGGSVGGGSVGGGSVGGGAVGGGAVGGGAVGGGAVGGGAVGGGAVGGGAVGGGAVGGGSAEELDTIPEEVEPREETRSLGNAELPDTEEYNLEAVFTLRHDPDSEFHVGGDIQRYRDFFGINSDNGELSAFGPDDGLVYQFNYEPLYGLRFIVNSVPFDLYFEDVNEDPIMSLGRERISVNYFAPTGTRFLKLTSTDPDFADSGHGESSHSFTVTGGAGFSIDEENWLVKSGPFAETTDDVALTITVTDGGGLTDQATLEVNYDLTTWDITANSFVSADSRSIYAYVTTDRDEAAAPQNARVQFTLQVQDATAQWSTVQTQDKTMANGYSSVAFQSFSKAAGTTYRIVASAIGLELLSDPFAVEPGQPSTIAIASPETVKSDGESYVNFVATVLDSHQNPVANGTLVEWGDFGSGQLESWEDLGFSRPTVNGRSTIKVVASELPEVFHVSARAGVVEETKQVTGTNLSISLELSTYRFEVTSGGRLEITARVRHADGTFVKEGIPIHWWDQKGLISGSGTIGQNGMAVRSLTIPLLTKNFSDYIGPNRITARVGSTIVADDDLKLHMAGGERRIKPDHHVIASDRTMDGSVTLETNDGLREIPYVAQTTVRIKANPNERVVVSIHSISHPDEPYDIWFAEETLPPNSIIPYPHQILTANDSGLVNTTIRANGGRTSDHSQTYRIRAVATDANQGGGWLSWWYQFIGWNSPATSETFEATIVTRPSDTIARVSHLTGTFWRAASGAIFGSEEIGAEMAGDVFLSAIPGIGVWSDIRDTIVHTWRHVAPSLSGPYPADNLTLSLSVIGILTTFSGPGDWIVTSAKTLVKSLNHSKPLFKSLEPLLKNAVSDMITAVRRGENFLTAEGVEKLWQHRKLLQSMATDFGFMRLAESIVKNKHHFEQLSNFVSEFGEKGVAALKAVGGGGVSGGRTLFSGSGGVGGFDFLLPAFWKLRRSTGVEGIMPILKGMSEAELTTLMRRVHGVLEASSIRPDTFAKALRAANSKGFITSADDVLAFAHQVQVVSVNPNSWILLKNIVSNATTPAQFMKGRLYELTVAAEFITQGKSAEALIDVFRPVRTDIDLLLRNGAIVEAKSSLEAVKALKNKKPNKAELTKIQDKVDKLKAIGASKLIFTAPGVHGLDDLGEGFALALQKALRSHDLGPSFVEFIPVALRFDT